MKRSGSGTTYQTTYREYNSVVGADWASSSPNHRVIEMYYSSPYPLYRYSWNSGSETFDGRTSTNNNTNDTDAVYNICVEQHKPASAQNMGYVWLDDTANVLYFDTD